MTNEPEQSWLKPSQILVDSYAQRKFDPSHAQRIAAEYDPALFGIGSVSLRSDGSYYNVDSQHRCAAACIAGQGEFPVRFDVYRGLTKAHEAALFLRLNDHKKKVAALDTFRVSVSAGHPEQCDIQRIVESFGLSIAAHTREGGISAVGALELIYLGKIGGSGRTVPGRPASSPLPKGHILSRTLHILTTAWGKERTAFDSVLLRGVAAMVHKHGAQLDAQRLAKLLTKSGPAIQAISGIRGLQNLTRKSPTLAAVEHLEGIYNKRSRPEGRLSSE